MDKKKSYISHTKPMNSKELIEENIKRQKIRSIIANRDNTSNDNKENQYKDNQSNFQGRSL